MKCLELHVKILIMEYILKILFIQTILILLLKLLKEYLVVVK